MGSKPEAPAKNNINSGKIGLKAKHFKKNSSILSFGKNKRYEIPEDDDKDPKYKVTSESDLKPSIMNKERDDKRSSFTAINFEDQVKSNKYPQYSEYYMPGPDDDQEMRAQTPPPLPEQQVKPPAFGSDSTPPDRTVVDSRAPNEYRDNNSNYVTS